MILKSLDIISKIIFQPYSEKRKGNKINMNKFFMWPCREKKNCAPTRIFEKVYFERDDSLTKESNLVFVARILKLCGLIFSTFERFLASILKTSGSQVFRFHFKNYPSNYIVRKEKEIRSTWKKFDMTNFIQFSCNLVHDFSEEKKLKKKKIKNKKLMSHSSI